MHPSSPLLMDGAWLGRIYCGGWVRAHGGDAAIVEPATGIELGRVGRADRADLSRAVSGAVAAQRAWAGAPASDRAAVLQRAGELFADHADEIRRWVVRETGAVAELADHTLGVAADQCHAAAALAARPRREIRPGNPPQLTVRRRDPVGVVAVITPGVAPLARALRSIAPALALGNAVILKPDPRTAMAGGIIPALVFEAAGLPAGVLHVLPAGTDVGTELVADPAVRVVCVTGSTRAACHVAELAGRHLTRVRLEPAGSYLLVVFADADLAVAVRATARLSFQLPGQLGLAAGRHLVHEAVADEYVAALADVAEGLAVGDPATQPVALGPLLDHGQCARLDGQIMSTVDAGCPARRRWPARGPLLPADRARRGDARHARVRPADARPGRRGHSFLHCGGCDRAGRDGRCGHIGRPHP